MDDLFQDKPDQGAVDYAEVIYKYIYRTKIALRAYWWILPIALLLGVAAMGLKAYFSDDVFKSESRMIVNGRISLPDGEVYTEERDNFFGTQIELIQSDLVKHRAIERVRLSHPELHAALVQTPAYDKIGFKCLEVDADIKEDTNVFDIFAFGPDLEHISVYLDAIMEEYVNRRREMRSMTSEKSYDFIVGQMKELEAEIAAGEDSLVEFQEKNNIVFIQEQGSAAGTYLIELKRRHAELTTERRTLDAILNDGDVDSVLLDQLLEEYGQVGEGLERPGRSTETLSTIFGTKEDNQRYMNSKEQVALLEAQLEEFSIYLKPKHPKIIGFKTAIERKENQLAIQRKQTLQRVEERRRVVESKISSLDKEIEIWEDSALENGRLIAEFERLKSRLDRSKEAYERNQESLRAIDSNQDNQYESVSVFEQASSGVPANSGMPKQLVIGGILGLGFGVFLIGGLASFDNRIISANDLEEHFDYPLLGAIPFEGESEDSEKVLLQKDDVRYVFAEACRNLRTSVLFVGEGGFQPRTFAVTSAIPSEGKSTVSANLAVALSFSHSKVLIIDADLRRGRLHHLFKCSREKGLMHLLQGEASFEEVVQKTNYDYLDIISIGGYPQHPAELLMSKHMDTLIEEAQAKYDFIIFDTAPILATDDTTSFASKLDTVLFAIRSQHTQVRQIKPAIGRLSERNIRVSGLILNFVDLTQPGYYYYRYSEYYSDSGKRDELVAK